MTSLRHAIRWFAGIVLCLALPSLAVAQCRLCDQPTTSRASEGPTGSDVELRVETNLNFDRLVLGGAGNGAVIIRPNGSTGAEGAVAAIGPRAMVGTVQVRGDPGREVRIELPRRIELFSVGGGRVTVDDITSDAASLPRLDASGTLSFRFGGRLILSGDADGQYRGDLPITVVYADEEQASARSLSAR
jgi:hypothetical protein